MSVRLICVLLMLFVSRHSLAVEPTRDVQQPDGRSGVHLELGFGLESSVFPLVGFNEESIEESDDRARRFYIALQGRLQFKGFFAEAVGPGLFTNNIIGYSFYDNDRGSLEFIARRGFQTLKYSEINGLESVENRDDDINLGIRSSHSFGENLVHIELVNDVTDSHNGFVGSLHVGREKQVLNWNLFGSVGLRYYSDNVVDHLFGVSALEATDSIPEYQGEAGIMPSILLEAVHPISEKWTFNAQAEYAMLPDSITDSPLAQGDAIYVGRIGFSYLLID